MRPGERVLPVSSAQQQLSITELHSRVLETDGKIRLVDDFNPTVITVTALESNQLRVRGEAPGITTIRITDEFDQVFNIEVYVEKDVRELQAHIRRLFPTRPCRSSESRTASFSPAGSRSRRRSQIVKLASTYSQDVQDHLVVGGGNQIILSCKIMEVQRSKLEAYGFNFLLLGQDYMVSSTPGGLAPLSNVTAPFGGPPGATTSQQALAGLTGQFAILQNATIFQGFVEALKQEQLLKILAEPVLVTTSGRPAVINSGGQFPLLVPQGLGATGIQFRDFGVSLEAVPIVMGNGRVQLDVAAEVSERDFANSIAVTGITVPGLTSRAVNTQVEMNFGETLMIGGLTQDRVTTSTNKLPILGDIPYLGTLFSRKNHVNATTELVILVTPHMNGALTPDQVPCRGPGQNSDRPTSAEIAFHGHVEVPNFGPECPPGGPGMICPDGSCYPGGAVGPGIHSGMPEQFYSAPQQSFESYDSYPVESYGAQGGPAFGPQGAMPINGSPALTPNPLPQYEGGYSPSQPPMNPPSTGVEGAGYRTSQPAYRAGANGGVIRDPGFQPASAIGGYRPQQPQPAAHPGLIQPRPQFVQPTPQFVPGHNQQP
ncbi:MAG: pilus assembly protein N-terminal domain-containing protein [Planctomycetaceae bacterium]